MRDNDLSNINENDYFFDSSEIDAKHPQSPSSSYSIFQGETNTSKPVQVIPKEPDYEKQRPLFAWLSTETIKKTYELTTQFARLPMSTILKKRYQSPNPALNVHRRSESVATDTVFFDTPAVDNGATISQFFVGTDSIVCDAYPMKSSSSVSTHLKKSLDNVVQ